VKAGHTRSQTTTVSDLHQLRRLPDRGALPSPGPSARGPSPVLALACTLLAALALCGPAAAQEYGVVHGEVRSENGESLAGALVEILSPSTRTTTTTDASGRYRIAGVPAGRSLVRATYLGHGTLELEVLVAGSRDVNLDLTLPLRPVPLETVLVESGGSRSATDSIAARDADLGLAGTRTLEATPGLTELGLAEAIRGIADEEPSDPGSVLYVRGAGADLKLVYLDGAPVYAPFPLGGILDHFTPGVLSQANIYVGGAPARYDGGLSYVMDLRTRTGPGRGFSTSGALDLLSARVLAEGGIADRASVLATARGMHPFGAAGIYGDRLPYDYREGFARGDLRVGATGLLSVTGFTNSEAVSLAESSVRDSVVEWGNRAGSIRLRGRLGAKSAEISAALGDYSARLPAHLGTREGYAEGDARRMKLSADFYRPGEVGFRYGASLDRQNYSATALISNQAGPAATITGTGSVAGAYAEAVGGLGARLRLRGGARADLFSATGDITLAPRLAATWLVSERAALTFAAGRYHQYLRPPDEILLTSPESTIFPQAALFAVARASHFTASLDQDLGEGVRLGIEGYYKEFSNVPGSLAIEANASGVDLWVSRATGAWTGSVGYSLAWVWSGATSATQESFDGRHLLSAGINGPIRERTLVDFKFAYGAGLPYSGINLQVAAPDSERLNAGFDGNVALATARRGGTETAPLLETPSRPFLRLDATISQLWTPRIGATTFAIEPYLKLLNGLGRRDALFYYHDGRGDGVTRPIGSFPVLPVIGVEWSTRRQ
jgi:hypothetical protein